MTLGFQCVSGKMRRKFTKNTGPMLDPSPPKRQRRREKVYLRTKNSRLRAFLFVGICVLMASCYDQGDCILTSSNLVRIDFYDSKATANAKNITYDSALVLPTNYLFFYDSTRAPASVSAILLPVDPTESETTFIMFYDKKVDTLVFSYTTQSKVLAPDCGTFSYQNDLTIVKSTFPKDSAVVVNRQLRLNFGTSRDPVTNVKIYH